MLSLYPCALVFSIDNDPLGTCNQNKGTCYNSAHGIISLDNNVKLPHLGRANLENDTMCKQKHMSNV